MKFQNLRHQRVNNGNVLRHLLGVLVSQLRHRVERLAEDTALVQINSPLNDYDEVLHDPVNVVVNESRNALSSRRNQLHNALNVLLLVEGELGERRF